MIERLKSFTTARSTFEDLIELSAFARVLFAEFEAQSLSAPQWLTAAMATLQNAIRDKVRDERMARLSEAKARRAQLRTPDEKRQDLDKEIEALETLVK